MLEKQHEKSKTKNTASWSLGGSMGGFHGWVGVCIFPVGGVTEYSSS